MKQLGQYAAPRHVVAHLSDPHLLAGAARQYGVIDTEAHLRRMLDRLAAVDPVPQVLVLTGDLADRAEPDAYRLLRKVVEPGDVQVWVASDAAASRPGGPVPTGGIVASGDGPVRHEVPGSATDRAVVRVTGAVHEV